MRFVLVLVFLALSGPATAQQLVFDDMAVQRCFARGDKARACIGDAATACMRASLGGETTVGMGGCYDRELTIWDQILNEQYQRVRGWAARIDLDNADNEYAPPLVPGLRDMQRAWISYRDATCDFERAQWGGGTGGGPATLSCLLQLTSEQALYLATQGLGDGQ